VNGTNYPASGGVITLPDYPAAGGVTSVYTEVTLSGLLIYDAEGSNLNFEVRYSLNDDFSNEVIASTTNSVTGWKFFDLATLSFTNLATEGLYAVDQGIVRGAVKYTLPTNTAGGVVYVRGRSYDGADWSDFQIGVGSDAIALNKGPDLIAKTELVDRWAYLHGNESTDESWRQGWDSVTMNMVIQVRQSGAWTNSVEFTRP